MPSGLKMKKWQTQQLFSVCSLKIKDFWGTSFGFSWYRLLCPSLVLALLLFSTKYNWKKNLVKKINSVQKSFIFWRYLNHLLAIWSVDIQTDFI